MKAFTIIRGGLHPQEPSAKPAKKEKYSPYQLQLIAQIRRRAIEHMDRHAERYWSRERGKNRLKQADDL